jgi:lipopolysaccharide/colanic/teichoic acid biosynthesis glycosyltransferase
MTIRMINLIDYIISILIFLITLPLTLISWILIFFLEESPIIYKSDRIGYKKNPFIVYKFRTMSTSNSSGVTLANDSRVTRLGLILRKFKVDELPQFFNIFKNQLSLVGPRPENIKYLNSDKNYFAYLNTIKPGIIDLVTLLFVNESSFLKSEEHYIEEILPLKSKIHNKMYKKYSLSDFVLPIFLTPIAILYPKMVQKIIMKYFLNSEYIDFQDKKYILLFIRKV